ncbi:YsnF/AvaK domain-containing protein [Sporolactobacillus sp. THM7-4]|nr:YsnF/AvaK domain-containing protein [Sporolactobacillus sp. THM7-4]
MSKSIIGVYETPEETVAAIERLQNTRGLDADDISVITNRKDTDYVEDQTGTHVNQATGHTESFFEKLKNYFTMDDDDGADSSRLSNLDIPAGEMDQYNEDLNEGKFLVAVDTNDYNQAAYSDLNDSTREEKTMPIREEKLDVNKRNDKVGEVELGKDVKTERKDIDTPVKHDEVYVERRPVNDQTGKASPVTDSEEIKVPIREEKVEVKKKPVVKDEVVVGKRTVEENRHISKNVKKEEPRLDKKGDVEEVDHHHPVKR